MEKDFDNWNKLKKEIENECKNIIIKEWEIWWTHIWLNIKSKSCWKWNKFRRPVLVMKKLSHTNCIIVPLSTQIKKWTWFANYNIEGIEYTALLYQIRMMHTNRFYVKETKLNYRIFNIIKKKLKKLLNF